MIAETIAWLDPIRFEIGDERLVDLHDVDRKVLEVAERRVSGPEVVEGQRDPEALELAEHDEGPLAVLDEDALGELERHPVRTSARLGKDLCDGRSEVC